MARLSFTEVGLLLLLVLAVMLSAEAREKRPKTLRRKKREWIPPPASLMENKLSTKPVAKIRSDKDKRTDLEYSLAGAGADKPPFNIFVVDYKTGVVTLTTKLDREEYPSYNLTGIARFKNGTKAEDDIPLIVKVLDENDNPPYFELHTGSVKECSKPGTFVMQIEGKDNDQAGTINSEIAYSIVSQEPQGSGNMFTLDKKTGKLYVKEHKLDREKHDFYKLIIKGTDLGGATGGLSGTGTVEIKVEDINDNKPFPEKSEYATSVDENVVDVVLMKVKAVDKDLEHTDNWEAVFHIIKGNEDNLFSITTDKETNEGILKLVKSVDFEEIQHLELGLMIENVAPFLEGGALLMDVDVKVGEGSPLATGAGAGVGVGVGAGAGVGVGVDAGADLGVDLGLDADVDADLDLGLDADLEGGAGLDVGPKPEAGLKPNVGPGVGVGLKPGVKPGPGKKPKPKPDAPANSFPIKIAVNNMPEGPEFKPDTKEIPVSENPNEVPEDGVIAVFAAIDPDTGKTAEDVSYAKAYDPDNWFTIDDETAEIKLKKAPDRESPFLVNGTYIAKILAITKDMPAKTATGTIAIQVTDANDHCPTLTASHSSLCSNAKTVYVTGFDEDASPNAAPFTFKIIPDGTQGDWDIEVINETSAALHSRESLWPGSYELQVEVTDAQGLSCPTNEIFTVDVCTCVETEDCESRAARLGTTTTTSELSAPAIGLLLMAMCLLLFIPLLLLFCQCGGAGTIFPDQFSDLPFDTREHLISYHTEGRGEDKEVPLQSMPIKMGTEKKVESAPARDFNTVPSKISATHQTTTFYNESSQRFQEIHQSMMGVENTSRFSREVFNHGNGNATFSRQTLGIQRNTDLYEDMALPETFLKDYYSQKAACAVPVKDSLLEYDFEGQGSPAGSVGCCSLLESHNDLQFLSDLGPKFKTLAEICSSPTPIPKSSLTHKTTVDIGKPVVNPRIEHSVETKDVTLKTEKVMSSTNISKSSISTVRTEPPSVTLPQSNVTNISHSSNITRSASLPRQTQTVILQQQPVYYTTSPVLQPMHYVVQPQLQNTVLMADQAHGANFPGLYVVSGPQNPSSGVIISGPKSPASPHSPVSPTLLLPGGLGVSQASVPAEGWKVIGPNADGTFMLVKENKSPGEAEGVDPGSSQGTLPRGAVLVKEAASPQRVLGPAAQGSVYGILPAHTIAKRGVVTAVNSNLGQTWVGQPGQMGLGSLTVLGLGGEQPQMGMGRVLKNKPEFRQTGISQIGTGQVNINQFERVPSFGQKAETSGILKAHQMNLQKEGKTTSALKNIITAETYQPCQEEIVLENQFKQDSDPAQEIHDDTVEEKQGVITFTLQDDTKPDNEEPSNGAQNASEDNEDNQEYPKQSEKTLTVNLEGGIVPGTDEMQTSFEQSDTVIKIKGGKMDDIVPDQLNEITGASTNKFTDVIGQQTTESSDQQQDSEESKDGENLVLSEGISEEAISDSYITQMSFSQTAPDVMDIVHTDIANEEISTFTQGEGTTSTSDLIMDNQVHHSKDEHIDEIMEEAMSDTSDSHKQELLLDSEVGLNVVGVKLPATQSNEISTDTVNAPEERSIPVQEAIPEIQVENSEGNEVETGLAKTDISDTDKTSLPPVSPILTNQEEGDLGNLDLASKSGDIITQVQEEGSNLAINAPLELQMFYDSSSVHKKDDDDNQQNVLSDSEEDKVEVSKDISTASEDNEDNQEYPKQSEKTLTVNLEGGIVPGPDEMQTSFEQSDTVIKIKGGKMDDIVPDQLNEITGASTNKFTDVISQQTTESSDQQQESEESKDGENLVLSEGISEEAISDSYITQMSSSQTAPDVMDIVHTDNANEEISTFTQGEGATSSSDLINIVDDEIHNSIDEHLDRKEEAPLNEEVEEGTPVQLSIVEGSEDQSFIAESEPQSNKVKDDHGEKEMDKVVILAEDEVASDLNQDKISLNTINTEGNMEEAMSDTSDSHKQEQLLDSEVMLNVVGVQLPATRSNEILTDTVNASEERSSSVQEAVPETQVDHSEDNEKDKGPPKTDITDEEATTSLQAVSPILTNLEEGDLGDLNLTSNPEDIVTQAEEEDSNVAINAPLEQNLLILQGSISVHKEDDDDNQQNVLSESGEDKVQVRTEEDSSSVVERDEGIAEEELSKQSFSNSDDQDEGTEKQHALSSVESVEEMASPVQHIPNDQKKEIERADAGSVIDQVEGQFISEDNVSGGIKEDDTMENVVSPAPKTAFIAGEDEDSEIEDASQLPSQTEDQLIPDGSVTDGEKEVPFSQQNICISNDSAEDSEREDAQGTSAHSKADIEPYQLLEEDSLSSETKSLSEKDLHSASQTTKLSQAAATSAVKENHEIPYEIRQGKYSEVEDISLDIPERQENVGQTLVNSSIEDLNDVVTSSEERRSSRVAEGQAPISSADKGESGTMLVSGQEVEDEATQSGTLNTIILKTEHSEGEDLISDKNKAEVTFDQEIKEDVDNSATNASGQVSPASFSEMVNKAISSELETETGSSETGTANDIATGEVAEESGDLVHSDSVQMIEETVEVYQNTLGKAGSMDFVSEAHMHGAEASGGELSPVQLQTVVSQTPRNKARKSKKDSNRSPKSPSGKCKQQ